jgi:hypothetical protein
MGRLAEAEGWRRSKPNVGVAIGLALAASLKKWCDLL